jgi:cation diffusion facilitator family transporter
MGEGQRVALVGVAISAFLAALKIFIGLIAGSSAVLADGIESTGDVITSGFVWLGLTWAAKPPDSNHPYGHGRAETLSGLIVGLFLIFGGLAISIEAFVSARSADRIPATYALWPLVVSIAVKIWMVRLKWVTGRRIGSAALIAGAMNDAVDMLSGIVAICALSLAIFDPEHFLRADHYGACVIGVIMLITGVRVVRRTGAELMDTMPEDDFVQRIREVAQEVPGIEGVEKVFARKTGLRHLVDIHLEVDPEMSVRTSHELGHRVEDLLLSRIASIADVLVHIEPAGRIVRRVNSRREI